MKDLAIVVQGPSNYVSHFKRIFGKNLIFSTWIGEENKYTNGDVVIFNQTPLDCGPANFNLQKVSTINGLLKAKDLGYDYALKIRSDLIPTNSLNFLKLLENDNLNFLCWYLHEVYPKCSGYLIDYLMSGRISTLLKIWEVNIFCRVPEIMITHQYISNLSNIDINFFLPFLNGDNDLYWIKNNKLLSSYNSDRIFSLDKKFLNNNYLNFRF